MTFYKSLWVLIALIISFIFQVISAIIDRKITTPVFKFSYLSILSHIALLFTLLYESVSLTEVAALFMASLLVYLFVGAIFSRRELEKEGREESDDL